MNSAWKPLTVLLTAVALAGCGGSDSGGDASAGKSVGDSCAPVTLPAGSSAKSLGVDKHENTDCATAQKVTKEWGGQQVGLGDANLPAGWACDGNSVCRKGNAVVTFTLNYG